MTGRISIPALRKQAEGPFDGIVYLDARVSLALVEAVEAARICWSNVFPNGNDSFQMQAHDRLRDKLARFDFGEET